MQDGRQLERCLYGNRSQGGRRETAEWGAKREERIKELDHTKIFTESVSERAFLFRTRSGLRRRRAQTDNYILKSLLGECSDLVLNEGFR
jgi:hypothetical protein